MKYIVKIASYKNSKSFFGGLIRFKQKHLAKLPKRYARFSHSEVVFGYTEDKEVLNRIEKIENINSENFIINRKTQFETFNLWFSSEEGTGSRFKFIEDNKNNWVFTEFEVSKEQYLKMLDFAIKENNNSYNWFGIFFNQTFKVNWFRKKGDWFCSQITCRVFQEICKFCAVDSIDISPGRLAKMADNFKK